MDVDTLEERPAVYVLAGLGGRYLYKGATRELRSRVKAHLAGKVARTRNRRPLQLVYFEYCEDYGQALQRESWLKSGRGRAFLTDHLARVAERQTQGT